jgi:hypothetical protein
MCYNVAVVDRAGVDAITCVVPKSKTLGRGAVVVEIAGTNSTEALVFTNYNDAGTFAFNANTFVVKELTDAEAKKLKDDTSTDTITATILVKRPTLSWAPPTNVTVSVSNGIAGSVKRFIYGVEQQVHGATSPDYFHAKTQTLFFAENQYEATFTVDIPNRADGQRVGAWDDRWAKLAIDDIAPLQGASEAGPYAKLVFEEVCATISSACDGEASGSNPISSGFGGFSFGGTAMSFVRHAPSPYNHPKYGVIDPVV